MIKVGDKYYCYNNYIKYDEILFTKGEYYIVVYKRNNGIIDFLNNNGEFFGFSSKSYQIGECKILSEYFLDKLQERKEKIKKIKGIIR